MRIGAVIFDENQEFLLCRANEDNIGYYWADENEKSKKYDPLVQLMYDFEQKFGKTVTCWEKMFDMDDKIIYAVRIDFNEIVDLVDKSEDCMILSIEDILSMEETTKEYKWMIYMALDLNMRNKKIIKDEEKRL